MSSPKVNVADVVVIPPSLVVSVIVSPFEFVVVKTLLKTLLEMLLVVDSATNRVPFCKDTS